MRILKLELQAIGPFSGKETIDFFRLGQANGLFLIHGATGAGKSMLLDAIVYALYANVSLGAHSSVERLRSKHAADDTPSYIKLLFETSNRFYLVERSPAYQRAKKRGQGTVAQKPEASLWEVPDHQVEELIAGQMQLKELSLKPIITGAGKVGQVLHDEILPLDREQFLQTVLLPQGAFAQFLQASSESRKSILQRIFRTEIFEKMEDEFKLAAAQARKTAQAHSLQIKTQLNQFLHGWEGILKDYSNLGFTSGDTQKVWLDKVKSLPDTLLDLHLEAFGIFPPELQTDLDQFQQHLEDQICTQDELVRQTQQVWNEAKKHHDLHRSYQDLLAQQAQLNTQSSQIGHLSTALEKNQRAKVAKLQIQQLQQSKTQLQQAVQSLNNYRDLPKAYADLKDDSQVNPFSSLDLLCRPDFLADPFAPGLGQQLIQLQKQLAKSKEHLDAQIAQLTPRQEQAERVKTTLEEVRYYQRQFAQQKAVIVRIRQEFWQLAQLYLQHLARLQVAKSCISSILTLEESLGKVTAHRQAEEAFLAAFSQWKNQRQQVEVLHSNYQDLSRHYRQLQASLYQDALSLVKSQIVPGTPCPACGSLDHPALEQSADFPGESDFQTTISASTCDLKTSAARQMHKPASAKYAEQIDLVKLTQVQNQVSAAKTKWQLARKESHAKRVVLLDQVKDLELQQAQLSRLPDYQQLSERLEYFKSHAQVEKCSAQVKQTMQDLHYLARQLQRAVDAASESGRNGKKALASFNAQRKNLPLWAKILRDGKQYLEQLVQARSQAKDLEQKLNACLEAARNYRRAFKLVQQLLTQQGFENISACWQAILPDQTVTTYQQEVQRHQQSAAWVEKQLASPEYQAVQQIPAKQLTLEYLGDLQQTCQVHQLDLEKKLTAKGQFQQSVNQLNQLWKQLQNQIADFLTSQSEVLPLLKLASLATGANNTAECPGTPLSTWVLLERFDEILALANPYLAKISKGRYQLRRTDRETSRRRNQALSLAVYDGDINSLRAVNTLSGGETFFCSLALALGLAEVVTAEAGGVTIESMFIDEGFGTLDSQTREKVLAALLQTAKANRQIGLISHVESLREIIADQIVVKKYPTGGSSLRIIGN